MIWLITGVFVMYCVWLTIILRSWYGLVRNSEADDRLLKKAGDPGKFYSIIIPFRNEEGNLSMVLDSIDKNDFPKGCYEVILVDDHSTDRSVASVEAYSQGSDMTIHVLKAGHLEGKKNALKQGINASRGEVIITTDADCSVGTNWLSSISFYFEHYKVTLVSGAVTFHRGTSAFQRLQVYEFASLVGVGAAAIHLGIPGMCNGANLAFTKDVFIGVGGYSDNEHLASGDDEFLLHKVAKKYPHGIRFNTFDQSYVTTNALPSFHAFFEQRKRWAGKWRHYHDIRNSLLAVFIGLVNIASLSALFLIVSGDYWLVVFLVLRALLEWVFIHSVLKFVNKRSSLFSFVSLYIIYPFYVVYFAIASNFGGYTWKGRRY